MRKLLMIASAAAMAVSMPALAQGNGKGQGAKSNKPVAAKTNVKARTDARAKVNRGATRANTRTTVRADANGNGILDRFERDADGDGIPDFRDATFNRSLDRNNNGILDRFESGSRVNFCPPGLAKKTPACIPPGQAKRMWNQGQRIPTSYRDFITRDVLLGRLPVDYRDDIPTGDYRYIYRDDVVYVVDPTTRLIRNIINIIR